MGGISDIITKLYRRFFLRDLLSYVCPGLIVITSIYYFSIGPCEFIESVKSLDIGFGGYVLIFLFSFVIGLGINAFIEYIIPDVTEDNKPEPVKIEFYKRMIKINCLQGELKFIQYGDKKKLVSKTQNYGFIADQRERYVILKQMSRNNFVAVTISTILYRIYIFPIQCIKAINRIDAIVMPTLFLLSLGLFISAKKTYKNQSEFEYVVSHCFQKNTNGRIEEHIENSEYIE